MLVMKVAILVLLSVIALTSCSGGSATFVFYAVIKPAEAGRFIGAITALAKEDGLETAISETKFNDANVLRVLEGRGHGLKLWMQNAPLSGHEDPILCGVSQEPRLDPAQFVVFTVPGFFGSKAGATKLGERVFSQLQNAGFDVRREPPICGAAALHDRA
jgi:hypothetical protein